MTDHPLVSVVIPVYNHASYVRECLDSVYNQSYDRLELVVIDDGSTDDSPDIAGQHLKKSPYPYQFSKQRNLGAHWTINKAIERSRGEYVAILNSDDRYHPERIYIMLAILDSSPSSRLAFSRVRHIDAGGEPLFFRTPHVFYYQRSLTVSGFFPTRTFEFLRSNLAVTTGNFLFHRSLYQDVGRFGNYMVFHDWDFLLRSILLQEPVFVEQDLLDYRVHAENTSRKYEEKRREETDQLLTSYLNNVHGAENEFAPGPRNWGDYWPVFVDLYLKHLNQYPHTWSRLQETTYPVRQELGEVEKHLLETLSGQAEAYFKLSEEMERQLFDPAPGRSPRSAFSLAEWVHTARRALSRFLP